MRSIITFFSVFILLLGCASGESLFEYRGTIHERAKEQRKVEVMAFVSPTDSRTLASLYYLKKIGVNVDLIDVDKEPWLPKSYNIHCWPTFIVIFMDGEKILDGYNDRLPIYETFTIRAYQIEVVEKIMKENMK